MHSGNETYTRSYAKGAMIPQRFIAYLCVMVGGWVGGTPWSCDRAQRACRAFNRDT